MLALEYDAELARQAWREEGKRDVVKNLLTMNLSLKDIARAVDWTEEEVRKFVEAEKKFVSGVGEYVGTGIRRRIGAAGLD